MSETKLPKCNDDSFCPKILKNHLIQNVSTTNALRDTVAASFSVVTNFQDRTLMGYQI